MWVSIQAAAELLQKHPNTIRRRIRANTIPHRQVELSGRMVYEVEVPDELVGASWQDANGDAQDVTDALRVEVGRQQAARELAESETAPLRAENIELRRELADVREAFVTVQAVSTVLERDRDQARSRAERLAEELASERADRDRELLRRARDYYLGGGIWSRLRRAFSPFQGLVELRDSSVRSAVSDGAKPTRDGQVQIPE